MQTYTLAEVISMNKYLNLGCSLMASSGKNRDFDTPFSTGVGRCSGWVKPGQPDLDRNIQEYYSGCSFSGFLHVSINHFPGPFQRKCSWFDRPGSQHALTCSFLWKWALKDMQSIAMVLQKHFRLYVTNLSIFPPTVFFFYFLLCFNTVFPFVYICIIVFYF